MCETTDFNEILRIAKLVYLWFISSSSEKVTTWFKSRASTFRLRIRFHTCVIMFR